MKEVVIIGAGFAGTALIGQFFRQAEKGALSKSYKLILVEKEDFATGAICRTTFQGHLLNVPAYKMSAFSDEPNHFIEWLKEKKQLYRLTDYVPRYLYGEYLKSILEEAEKKRTKTLELERISSEAIGVHFEQGGYRVLLDNNTILRADVVILAMGSFPTFKLPGENHSYLKSPNYIPNSERRLPSFPPNWTIGIAGTGLTAIDKLLEIHASGHRGKVIAISRSGRFPETLPEFEPPFFHSNEIDFIEKFYNFSFDVEFTAKSMLRAMNVGLKKNVPFDVFRDYFFRKLNLSETKIREEWENMNRAEKRKMSRFVQKYLLRLIHTAPQSSMRVIEEMELKGQLEIRKGALTSVTYQEEKPFKLHLLKKSDPHKEVVEVDLFINCLGHIFSPRDVTHPLITQMLGDGIIRPNEEEALLDATIDNRIIDRQGKISDSLFVLGALQRFPLGGIAAVPYISIDAYQLAARLLSE